MDLKLISRFTKNSLIMFSIFILLSTLISFCFTTELSNKDFLNDNLYSAALEVISLHSSSFIDSINEDLSQQTTEDIDSNGHRSRRSVPSFFNIPVLDNSSNLVPDPELMRSHKIWEMMNNLKERFVFQQTYLQKISDALKYAIKPNSNQLVITSDLIRNLTALNGMTVTQIKSLTNIFWQNSRLNGNDLKYKLKDLIQIIGVIEQRIASILQSTSDVVLKNRQTVITGRKHFVGHNEISFLNTTSAVIGFVGRQDLRQILNNIYRKSRPQIVRGVKHVVKPTFVKNSLISNQINGINFDKQMVTTNSPQIIKGLINFNSQLTVTNDLTIRGKLNNFDLNKDIVFLNRPETISARKVFTSPLIIAQRVDCQTIDGLDLQLLSKNVLFSNGLQTLSSKLILTKPLTTNSISVNGMVNDIKISAMADQLVYKNRPVLVKGKKTFILDDMKIKNNIYITDRLDGLIIPNDLMLKRRDQIIIASKQFRGNTRFEGKVSVNGLVDGLRLPQDIVTLTRNEAILGPIIFGQSIAANEDIDARRLVDGVDLSDLRLYSLKLNDKLIQSNVRFIKPVTVGAVDLAHYVNGINLNELFREAIFKDSPNVEIIGTKFFDSHIKAKELYTERVNDINLMDLVSTNKNETIVSPKLFTGLTAFTTLDVKGLVGRVDVLSLYNNRISLSKPQIITGSKHFLNEVIVGNGMSVQRINGLVPEIDFVVKSKFQEINGQKVFLKTLNTNKLMAKNPILVRGRINNIALNDINSRRIPLNSHQTLPLRLTLVNCSSSYVEVLKDINGLNITQFANNVMSLTKPQLVFAPKLFRSQQTFSRISSSKGISGISLSYLNANAVHLNGLSQITGPFTFTHPVVFNKPLKLNGVINGVNVSYIALDAVYKTAKNFISGQNVFKSGFRVDGNIHAFGFNGIDLSNELLTNIRDHIIRGKVKFTKSLVVKGDVVLDGLVSGLDLSELDKKIMKTNNKNLINGNLELIGTTKVLTDLKIFGRLNGINLTELFANAVFFNTNQDITGIKTIVAPIQALSHLNTTQLNGINVLQLLNDIVFINNAKQQIITAPKIFTNDVMSNGLIQTKGIAIMASINGVDLNRLNWESIKTNKPTVLQKMHNFKDEIIITNNFTQIFGRINGIDLMKDAILLHSNTKPQVITGNKTFEHLVLNDNAIINGLVNGMSLKDLELNTFLRSNVQRIIGHKIFKGVLELSSGYNSVGVLNRMRIPEDLVTLNQNQTLSAHLVFNNPLYVNNLFVSGLLSGHNLTKLATESLVKDRPQVLSQPIKFDSIVFKNDVMVDQHVDNVDLSSLSKTVKQFTSVVNISKDLMIYKANRHHFVSDYLFQSLEKSVFQIDSFELYQTLDEIHGNHIEILPNGVLTLSEIIEIPQTIHSIKYNPKTDIFDVSLLNQNPNLILKPFILKGEEFVIHMNWYSYNFSSHITKSGQLVAQLGYFINSVQVLNINENKALLVSFQSNTGKLMVHSLESLPNNTYIFNKMTESIVGTDTSKVIAFLKQNQVHIVVTKYYGMNCVIDSSGTLIFVLRNNQTLELIQKIPLLNVVDVVHFKNNGRHYLALSDSTSTEISMNPQTIHIFRSELMKHFCGFSLFQKLEFDNVLQLSAFTYGTIHSKHQYLVAINSSNVMIWRQKGESGFSNNWLLNTRNARIVVPVIAAEKLHLIVGQSYKCHESMIFRAETIGMALTPVVYDTKYT